MVGERRTAGILAALALSTAAVHGQARADATRAWAAAKAGLPAEARAVIGIDVATVQKTQLFATFYPKLHDQPEFAKVLDAIKNGCKIDPLAVVQGLVVALSDDKDDGVMYLALSGIDRTRLSSCLQSTAQASAPTPAAGDKPAKVTVKQDGNLTEVNRGDETGYFGWVGKDVVVVTLRATDKASLTKWMGGKGAFAKSDIGKTLAKVNPQAAVWGAGTGNRELQPGMVAKGGYGAVNYAKGQLQADVHVKMESAAQAGSASIMVNQQLNLAKSTGQVPAELAPVVQAIAVSAENDEIRMKASVAEKDVLAAITFAMNDLGSP
ncbi:MAG TPA: hypothetical protein VHW23_43605 [Kofleriaceae bacterium]|nr:hypothetical protein [Kofleriaceae bacterium]